jgi:hypothetical protein
MRDHVVLLLLLISCWERENVSLWGVIEELVPVEQACVRHGRSSIAECYQKFILRFCCCCC